MHTILTIGMPTILQEKSILKTIDKALTTERMVV
jgi:hypothetical protein